LLVGVSWMLMVISVGDALLCGLPSLLLLFQLSVN
jgi:hypothetical protein